MGNSHGNENSTLAHGLYYFPLDEELGIFEDLPSVLKVDVKLHLVWKGKREREGGFPEVEDWRLHSVQKEVL